jgi:hypothetical protein
LGPDDFQPVLQVSRRGEVVATMVDPKAPFPEYHGRGGRLGRTGDPLPRVSGVTAIRVFLDPPSPPPSLPSSPPAAASATGEAR